MEENLHKDNLEDFFKNSFNNENIEPSDDQWDVPSDAVWSGINKKINPTPISTSAFNFKSLLAIAASILILGLVYYNYTLQNEVAQLKELVENQKNTIDGLKEEILTKNGGNGRIEEEFDEGTSEAKSNSVVNGEKEEEGRKEADNNVEFSSTILENSSSETVHIPSQPKKSKTIINQNNSKKDFSKQQIIEKDKSLNAPLPNSSPDIKPDKKKDIAVENSILGGSSIIIANDDSAIINSQSEIPNPEKSNQKLTDPNSSEPLENSTALLIPLLSKTIVAQVSGHPEEVTLDLLPVPEEVFKPSVSSPSRTGFYVGAHIAPTYSYRNIKSVNGPVLRRLLNEKEQANYSVALGLKGGYQFSKNWSVESGLNFYKNTIQSTHLAQIRYESQIERLNSDGNYDSNYHLNLSTSYGEIETDVALTRSSDTPIDQNDYINLVLKTRQELKYLGVPIAVRYRTAGNKFHFSAKAGISGNFILQKEVTIKAATVNRNGVHHRRTIVDRKFSGLKNITFDFLFGIGADYDISKNMSIYFEPTVTHSLNPVYHLDGKIKTYPIVASLNIGLSYRF